MNDEERIARATAFYQSVSTRRTCRQISNQPVPREIIEIAIRAAGTAPSGANHQPWHFAVIGTADMKHKVRLAAEEEEKAFYAGKASAEWIAALNHLGLTLISPILSTRLGSSSSSDSAAVGSIPVISIRITMLLKVLESRLVCCWQRSMKLESQR